LGPTCATGVAFTTLIFATQFLAMSVSCCEQQKRWQNQEPTLGEEACLKDSLLRRIEAFPPKSCKDVNDLSLFLDSQVEKYFKTFSFTFIIVVGFIFTHNN
jgi:hypothetical protein